MSKVVMPTDDLQDTLDPAEDTTDPADPEPVVELIDLGSDEAPVCTDGVCLL